MHSPVHTVAEKCDCRRKRRDNGDSRRIRRQWHFSTTNCRTFLRQCGQALKRKSLRHYVTRRTENDVTQRTIHHWSSFYRNLTEHYKTYVAYIMYVCTYQLISQPKLDKFQSQCYSKCSRWRSLVSTHKCSRLHHWSTASSIIIAGSLKPVKASLATRRCARCPSTLIS